MSSETAISLAVALMLELLKKNAEGSQIVGRAIQEGRPLTPEEMTAVKNARDAAIDDAQRAIDEARGS